MNEINAANILGINASGQSLGTNKKTENTGDGFSEAIKTALSGGSVSEAEAIVLSFADSMQETLNSISASYDLTERQSLAQNYRDAVVSALQGAGFDTSAGASPDKIVMDGRTYDILSSLNTPGAKVSSQFIVTGGSDSSSGSSATATASAQDVLFATGREQNDLIQKINSASTLDERMSYVDELRDIMVESLNDSGHNAYSYGKHDKIVVNGNLIDFLLASNGVGMNTKVQWLDHGPAVNHGITPPDGSGSSGSGGDYSSAIFSAGSQGNSILSQISSSVDLEERRALANSFQELIVNALKEQGYQAEVHSDPDKITLNGITFDVIRSLNTPGAQASLQALRVI